MRNGNRLYYIKIDGSSITYFNKIITNNLISKISFITKVCLKDTPLNKLK
jgi:hypothetical protein